MLLITREVDLYNQTSSILQCKCYFLYALPINDMMVQAICQFIHSAHSANTVLVPNACRYYVSNTRALKHCGTVTFFRKIKIFFKKQYIILLLLDIQNVPKARYNIYFSLIATFLPTITSEKNIRDFRGDLALSRCYFVYFMPIFRKFSGQCEVLTRRRLNFDLVQLPIV